MDVVELNEEFHRTDKKLREVLEATFATSDIMTVDEIAEEIHRSIFIDLDFLVYIREKRWFGKSVATASEDFLKFNFISFERSGDNLRRFPTLSSLNDIEIKLIDDDYDVLDKSLCRIVYCYRGDQNIKQILNLVSRIIVAFYKNCGSLDHFRESVSARYIKEFYTLYRNPTPSNLIDYIEERSEITMALFHQKDDMFFRKDVTDANELLNPFPKTDSSIPAISKDPEFIRSLIASVVRKNQTHGKASTIDSHFAIKTFVEQKATGPDFSNTNFQPVAVAVFTNVIGQRISLENIYHANSLTQHYIKRFNERLAADFGEKADEACLQSELEVSEAPCEKRTELLSTIAETLKPALNSAMILSRAETIRFWLFNRYDGKFFRAIICEDNCLQSFVDLTEGSVMLPENHIVPMAMKNLRIERLANIDAILSEQKATHIYRDALNREDRLAARAKDEERRTCLIDSSGIQGAALAIPVTRGVLPVGVIEVTAADVGRLNDELPLHVRLAKIFGDVIRRIELANDRGWMTQMSFIHAVRHRVEAILRGIEEESPIKARELLQLLDTRQRADQSTLGKSDESSYLAAEQRIQKFLESEADEDAVEEWLEKFREVREAAELDLMACRMIGDIVETLVSNKVHSDFQIQDLDISCVAVSEEKSEISIKYTPGNIMRSIDILERISISPIRDAHTPTFHYGLFLLAAHLRMFGGSASVLWPLEDDGIGNAEFGLTFSLPSA